MFHQLGKWGNPLLHSEALYMADFAVHTLEHKNGHKCKCIILYIYMVIPENLAKTHYILINEYIFNGLGL